MDKKYLNNTAKFLFFLLFVKPFIFFVLGINVRNLEKLLQNKGPAIIVANHNSHIDTLLIMSLFPILTILKIHPVAAADYFCNTKFKSFIFKTLIGIIPISRHITRQSKEEVFADINGTKIASILGRILSGPLMYKGITGTLGFIFAIWATPVLNSFI